MKRKQKRTRAKGARLRLVPPAPKPKPMTDEDFAAEAAATLAELIEAEAGLVRSLKELQQMKREVLAEYALTLPPPPPRRPRLRVVR